jgi:hypothetical protein
VDETAPQRVRNPQVNEPELSPGSGVPTKKNGASKPDGSNSVSSAFDVWLERGLHTLFDDVTNEPIPVELLRLIEADRHKAEDEDKK